VVDLAINEEIKRSPDYGEVVIDVDEWIVNAFFDLRFAGLAYALGERFKGHLRGFAVAHEHHGSAGECGGLDRSGVSFGHAVEHGLDGGEDGLLV